MAEAVLVNNDTQTVVVAAGTARSRGEIFQLSDGRAAVSQNAFASTDPVSAAVSGRFSVACATGTAFTIGYPVYWDASANLAVAAAVTLDGDADFFLGVCSKTKTTETAVEVDINAMPSGQPTIFVAQFDCETEGATDFKTIIPVEMNRRGLIIESVFGIVAEQFGGGTEDQGVVTVEDDAGTDVVTITVADAGADAVGDIRFGYERSNATAGDAAKTVAAGKAVRGLVSQQTTGTSAAGKLNVYVIAQPLV